MRRMPLLQLLAIARYDASLRLGLQRIRLVRTPELMSDTPCNYKNMVDCSFDVFSHRSE
ncbi:MAG: hypothetical protein ACXWJK_02320 [Burkholderiaceae bacterium]